ncbi:MAG: hypothetical protein AAB938_00110 [Patescibacteria group bacterium]
MKPFPLAITDIASTVFEGNAVSVTCPGSAGELTILAGHMPLVTTLRAGSIRVKDANGREHEFPATGGIVEVTQKSTTILL